jgi:hypothetical protein
LSVSYFKKNFVINGSTPVLDESAQNKEPIREQNFFSSPTHQLLT